MNELDTTANSFRDLVFIGCKRLPQIVLFFSATFTTVLLFTLLVKPTYEAKTQILVKVGRESVYVPAIESVNPVVAFDSEKQVNSEVEILKSQALAERIVLEIGPAVIYPWLGENYSKNSGQPSGSGNSDHMLISASMRALLSDLTVEAVKKSNLITLKFQHQDPVMAATVVNRFADMYVEHHLEIHKNKQSADFFKEQVNYLKLKLEQSEYDLENFKREKHITSYAEQQTILLLEIAKLQSEHNRALSMEIETKKRLTELRGQMISTAKSIDQGEETDPNYQVLSNLQSRLLELELQEKQLLTKYTDESRLVRNVREEIQVTRGKLKEQADVRYGKKKSGVNPVYQKIEEQILNNVAELKALMARAEHLENRLNSYQAELDRLRQIEVALNRLTQEVDLNRQNHRLYLHRLEESRISDVMDNQKISSVTIIEHAHPPLFPVRPKVMLNLALGVVTGLLGGVALAFSLEYLGDRFNRPEDVERFLESPVLTSIPELKPTST